MTATIATPRPSAVATSASEMPAATTAKPPVPAIAMLSKDLMMPTTVPRSPINGALLATVPRIHRCFLSFWLSSNIASAAILLATSSRPAASCSRTFRNIRPAGDWEFCLQIAMARSRWPFLIGSRSDSVTRKVMAPTFLSDHRRSNTTATLMIDKRIKG